MGAATSCIEAEFVVNVGKKILKDFFSKSTLKQMYSAVNADSHCEETTNNLKEVQNYMTCSFMRGMKDAWEWVLVSWLCLLLCAIILGVMLWKKTTNVITQVRHILVTRNQNLMIGSNTGTENLRRSRSGIQGGNNDPAVINLEEIGAERRRESNEWVD